MSFPFDCIFLKWVYIAISDIWIGPITAEFIGKQQTTLDTDIPHYRNQTFQPSSQPTNDRILARWERDFDIVIPTLVSSERLEPTIT